MIIINEDILEVNTVEAFYGNIILANNSFLIPYINLGLSDHTLNKGKTLKFIDYCYIIAEDINYLKFNKDAIIEKEKKTLKAILSI